MKVIILAAGKGSRLGDLNIPKALTLLDNGQSILGLQLANLSKYISLEKVIIVVGFHKELVMEHFPELLFVYNPNYSQENTSKSLLKALKKIEEEDVIWLNGDVVFHPNLLPLLLEQTTSCMIVNQSPVEEEAVKYRTNGENITEVSKVVTKAEGEAVGINLIKAKDLSAFIQELETCQDTDYFEKALEGCINQGICIKALVIPADSCTEVDFPQDLCHANQLLKEWGGYHNFYKP